MSESKTPQLIAADRLGGSLVITFEDGRSGIYSSEILYALLSSAKELCDEAAEVPEETVTSDRHQNPSSER